MTKMENGEIVFSGYLSKSPPESKLRNLRSWTRRYFVLYTNKLLYYYKSDREKRHIKEPIKLSHCKCVEANLNHERFKFLFSVVTDKRTYYLVADSQLEMETWVEKLCHVCGFRRTDSNQSSGASAAQKTNAYSTSPARPQPIAGKHHPVSPPGTPSSFSSSASSSLTSPTGPCPLSIPKHFIDNQSKQRSNSDPPEHPSEPPQGHRERFRRQSEQIVSLTSPLNIHGLQSKARLSGNLSENYDEVPSPRPLSPGAYDNLPSPKKNSQTTLNPGLGSDTQQDNYDEVPIPRALDRASGASSPRGMSKHLLSPDDYDAVPPPRPVSQASNRSSQDVYDIVPPPRPTSSCSQDGQSLYDVPPIGKAEEQENYDIVPPFHRPVALKPNHLQPGNSQENYDIVPRRQPSPVAHDNQSLYDVPPFEKSLEQENYDIVPPVQRPVVPKSNLIQAGNPQGNYVVPSRQTKVYNGRPSDQENYDIVPPVNRPIPPKPTHIQQGPSQANYDVVPMQQTSHRLSDGQSTYDNLPAKRRSSQENYDIVPPVQRPITAKPGQPCSSQDNYDIVPTSRPSNDDYDVVPPPRATPTSNHSNGIDNHFSDIYSVPPNLQSQDAGHEWVPAPPRPAPYRPSKDAYDHLPNTNRPVSADSGLNASFSSICSLKSEGDGQDDRYNAPLPALPSTRDSGSLSDDSPDDMNPSDIYDRPPNWESRNSIYDVPPKQENVYDALPKQPDEVYDITPMTSDDIYDVPPSNRNEGLPSESTGVPVVDRSTKRPPQVNRAVKPKTLTTPDHKYCNMPPQVHRETKYKRSTMPQIEHSYINMGATPPRPQNLPLVKSLAGNPFVGSLSNQQNCWSAEPVDDADYCPMQPPTRSEMTRCYSIEERPKSRTTENDQSYEDMSAVQTRRYSSGRSNSSSSSSLADNDDLYMPMAPTQHGASPVQMYQRHKRDLLYAEVEIIEAAHHNKTPVAHATPPRRENTHYTYINEESTRALLQTSHARQGNR